MNWHKLHKVEDFTFGNFKDFNGSNYDFLLWINLLAPSMEFPVLLNKTLDLWEENIQLRK